MLQLVLMVPFVLMSLDFMAPWPWHTHEEKLEKLLNTMNTTFVSKGESGHEPNIHHGQFYDDYPDYQNNGGGGEDAVIAALMGMLVFIIIGSILLCLSGLIFACQYKAKVTDSRPPLQGGAGTLMNGDFRTGPFSCLDDTPTCCHATFCGACRAGDTYQAAGAQQFWTVIGLTMLANIIANGIASVVTKNPSNQQNIGRLLGALITGGIFHGYRRQLRTKLGGGENAAPVYMDFLLWAFCSCCVIAQEARELDAAMGVRVECCCNLVQVAPQPGQQMQMMPGQPQVTGQPVGVYPATNQAFAGQPQVTGQPV